MQFTQIKVDWDINTFMFYLAIILSCYFIAVAGRRAVLVSGVSVQHRKELWIVLISTILIFVKGFGTTGRDIRGGYLANYLSATSWSQFRDQSVEIGYRILNVIVRKFTDEYWIFILICSLITIIPVIHMLKKYADQIDLPIAVLLYVTCYFFNCFSPMRQAMSASLAFYGFDAMVEHRYGKAIVWVLLASSIHISAIIFIVPIFITMAKLIDRKFIGTGLVCLFILLWAERQSLINFFAVDSGRYAMYDAFTTVDVGFEQVIYYIPLFLIFIFGRKNDNNKSIERVSFIYLCIEALGRFNISFVSFIIIIPYYCLCFKKRFPKYRILFNFAVVFYCIARFVIFMLNYYNSQDLMPYTNIFGWVI